jgi:hypothetical protein
VKLSDKSSIILSDIEEKNRASSLEAAFKLTASRQMWLDDQKKLNSLIRPFESELRQFGCEVIYSHEAIGVINPFRLPKRVRFCDGKYSNFSIDRLNDSFGGIAIHIFWPYNGTLNPWLMKFSFLELLFRRVFSGNLEFVGLPVAQQLK